MSGLVSRSLAIHTRIRIRIVLSSLNIADEEKAFVLMQSLATEDTQALSDMLANLHGKQISQVWSGPI